MAEVPDGNRTLHPKTIVAFCNELSQLIQKNSLKDITQIIEPLNPEQRIRILNSTKKGCTPLFQAIIQNNVDISRYFLVHSLRQGRFEMCETWKKTRHPLIAAMGANNAYLVELIAANLWDINEYLYCPYTPLMLAVRSGNIKYVRLMVDLGADINLTTCNGRSVLMISTVHFKVCHFLLKMNVNVNHQDDNGDTALHLAVIGKYIESVKLLVNAGADVRIRNAAGMTPLMLAVAIMYIPAIVYLDRYGGYPELDIIEAMEVVNACFVCDNNPIIIDWIRTIEMRRGRFAKVRSLPPLEILDFSTEFTTVSELIKLTNNPLRLAFQGILVIGRVLGTNNGIYLRVVLQASLIAKNVRNYHKVRQLVNYIQECCRSDMIASVSSCSSFFIDLFNKLALDAEPELFFKNRGLTIFRIIAQAAGATSWFFQGKLSATPYVDDSRYSHLVDTCLYMASIIRSKNIPQQYLSPFYEIVVKLVVEDPRVVNQQSLLHRAIKLCKTEAWSSVGLIRLLLECGADVDCKDIFQRTPLIYVLKHIPNNHIQGVVSLLLEYGCHVDCKDNEGVSVMDAKRWMSLPISKNPRSLQCHAVEMILDNQIDYKGKLNKILEEFIDLHV